jgi:hypothetical protein
MPAVQQPDWKGRTVVCIASGPSLTQEDCDAVRAAGPPVTIVTNTTFRRAPWADVLFGFDSRWWNASVDVGFDGKPWKSYRHEVDGIGFRGRCITAAQHGKNFGCESIFQVAWFRIFANSGACAISLAISGGAAKVVLLGYDFTTGPNGEKHWHADHKKISNCASMPHWDHLIERVADYARKSGVTVLNSTRRSAIVCFKRVPLQEALA